jgi:type I restriction enzyme R subunit
VIKLPPPRRKEGGGGGGGGPITPGGIYEHLGTDILETIAEEAVGYEGMKIDRMFFEKFEETVRENKIIAGAVDAGQWDRVIDYVNREVFDKPDEYYTTSTNCARPPLWIAA